MFVVVTLVSLFFLCIYMFRTYIALVVKTILQKPTAQKDTPNMQLELRFSYQEIEMLWEAKWKGGSCWELFLAQATSTNPLYVLHRWYWMLQLYTLPAATQRIPFWVDWKMLSIMQERILHWVVISIYRGLQVLLDIGDCPLFIGSSSQDPRCIFNALQFPLCLHHHVFMHLL